MLALEPISLSIAAATTEVRVSVTNYELAEEQVKVEETQRVLGVIPHFYVSYRQDALPLRPKQKFELAWKTSVDPVTFAASGAFAGVQQAQNEFSGYGQGAHGYAKRYGAAYGDALIGTMIGGAILPSLLRQDPRYFYKGTGARDRAFFMRWLMRSSAKGTMATGRLITRAFWAPSPPAAFRTYIIRRKP